MPSICSTDLAPALSHDCLFSGTDAHPIYVDRLRRTDAVPNAPGAAPIVMLHGAFHTGACYLTTPDGREGWAPWFARQGRTVYVVDWPGHGRSPRRDDFAQLSGRTMADSMAVLVQQVARDAAAPVVMAHSASGPMAWWLAEQHRASVAAVVGVAPGAPGNLLPELPDDPLRIAALSHDESLGCPMYSPLDRPVQVGPEFMRSFWANAPRFPHTAFQAYARSVVAESARLVNERFNIGGAALRIERPERVGERPLLVITGPLDPRHPRVADEAVARLFGGEFMWLPDLGIDGNGHMLMIEDNSLLIAELIERWLCAQGL
jgi:pimeloyl-ACP methyl ester carboxylesterase